MVFGAGLGFAPVSHAAVIGILVLLAAGPPAAPPMPYAPSVAPPGSVTNVSASELVIDDGETVSALVGFVQATLTDSEVATQAPTSGYERAYDLSLSSQVHSSLVKLEVSTDPLTFWADPSQLPNGPDNLPPLSEWSFYVTTAKGVNDTANWSYDPSTDSLVRQTVWKDQTYEISGRCNETVNLTVYPGSPDGANATGGGYVLNAPGYANMLPTASGYDAMAASLRASVVRISAAPSVVGWNTTSGQPVFSFAGFDADFDFANTTGAAVLVSLSAGDWGDGNTAPSGTPVYSSTSLGLHGLSGYLLTAAAEYAIVRGMLNHTLSAGENVSYWDVGNEVPLASSAATLLYAKDVDAAVKAVQAAGAPGLVGTDTAFQTAYLPTLGAHTSGVGFLSFHYYPAPFVCTTPSGKYCAPSGGLNGTTTPVVFSKPSYGRSAKVYGPSQAQSAWYNATGNWVPILNDETNFDSSGGGILSSPNGSDPRINDLVGAAWLSTLLIDSSLQNVSALTYFSLSSGANLTGTASWPDGGWGFGLTNVTPGTDRITYFAPFFVMKLWDQYLPMGSAGLTVTSSDPASVEAFAVSVNGNVNLAISDRVGVPIHIRVIVSGPFEESHAFVLDPTSYSEVYNATTDSTTLARAGVASVELDATGAFPMAGYGFALVQFAPRALI